MAWQIHSYTQARFVRISELTSFFHDKIDPKTLDQLRFEFAECSNEKKQIKLIKARKTISAQRGKVKALRSEHVARFAHQTFLIPLNERTDTVLNIAVGTERT